MRPAGQVREPTTDSLDIYSRSAIKVTRSLQPTFTNLNADEYIPEMEPTSAYPGIPAPIIVPTRGRPLGSKNKNSTKAKIEQRQFQV